MEISKSHVGLTCVSPWVKSSTYHTLQTIQEKSGLQVSAGNFQKLFRPDQINDATLRATVPVAAQRLVRWSLAPPSEIFWNGFIPTIHVAGAGTAFPSAPDDAFNLKAHVGWNPDSIFVSTTQPHRHPSTDALTVWSRTLTSPTEHRFEYEIFALGGIDVNAAIGVQHQCADQHEIAFPGGIRTECIRSAREYMGTKIIRIWENTNFDHTVNQDHAPALYQLPAVRHTPNGAPLQSYPGTGPSPPHEDNPACARLDTDELMRGNGNGVADDLYDVKPVPRNGFSCVPHHVTTGRSFFFCGTRYAHITIDVVNGKMKNTLSWGPELILPRWASLATASFAGGVDAVLQNPDNRTKEMYFFSGDQYILANVVNSEDYVVEGPTRIVNGWPNLRKAGFKTVNAVLEKPVTDKEVWFFSGEKYALVDVTPGSNKILKGPLVISNNWPSVKKAGFKTVDAILPHPYQGNEAFFFAGTNMRTFKLIPQATLSSMVQSPFKLTGLLFTRPSFVMTCKKGDTLRNNEILKVSSLHSED